MFNSECSIIPTQGHTTLLHLHSRDHAGDAQPLRQQLGVLAQRITTGYRSGYHCRVAPCPETTEGGGATVWLASTHH